MDSLIEIVDKLEEKVMKVLAELENNRKKLFQLEQENHSLQSEKTNHVKKLQGLASLLDELQAMDHLKPEAHPSSAAVKSNQLETV